MMKKLTKAFSVSLILILSLVLGSLSASATGFIPEASSRLQVTGNAVVTAAPDIAHISLGVETSDNSAEHAAEENARRMADVLAALKELGLSDSEISTSGYNIYSYNQTFGRNTDEEIVVTTYNVQNRINISTTNLDQVGKIVDVAVKAGANQVQGVSFDIADKQELQLQALRLAITQAQAKADVMAESAGVVLGGITTLTENYGTYAPLNDSMLVKQAFAGAPETSINPGEVEVSVKVTMEYWF